MRKQFSWNICSTKVIQIWSVSSDSDSVNEYWLFCKKQLHTLELILDTCNLFVLAYIYMKISLYIYQLIELYVPRPFMKIVYQSSTYSSIVSNSIVIDDMSRYFSRPFSCRVFAHTKKMMFASLFFNESLLFCGRQNNQHTSQHYVSVEFSAVTFGYILFIFSV